MKPGQPAKSTTKLYIHGLPYIWSDHKGVLYHELFKSGQTIRGQLYRQQLIRLKQAIDEKRPEWATRHEQLICHHDNARPHVAVPLKNYLENAGWEILSQPPYSPDIAASDYHLFRWMQNHRSGIRFTNVEGITKWLDDLLGAKDEIGQGLGRILSCGARNSEQT